MVAPSDTTIPGLDSNVQQAGTSAGSTQQAVISREEYIGAALFSNGQVQRVEWAEAESFNLPGTVRFGAPRNDDFVRE